jgi:hypothetical protein
VKWQTSTNGKYASNPVVTFRNLLLRYMKCFIKHSLMNSCAEQRLLNGVHRSKFDKLQLIVRKFQVISFDAGAGKMQKCNKPSVMLAGPIIQYMLMYRFIEKDGRDLKPL